MVLFRITLGFATLKLKQNKGNKKRRGRINKSKIKKENKSRRKSLLIPQWGNLHNYSNKKAEKL